MIGIATSAAGSLCAAAAIKPYGEFAALCQALRTHAGWATVVAVAARPTAKSVFNFEVAETHTYFVGSPKGRQRRGGQCI